MPKDHWRRASDREHAARARAEIGAHGELRSYQRAWDNDNAEPVVALGTAWHPDDWQTYLKARSHLREKNQALAAQTLEPLVDKGYAEAQFFLGAIHYHEFDEVSKAVTLFELAARQGHADAMFFLASAHLDGDGVEQDSKKAFTMFHACIDELEAQESHWISSGHFGLARCYLFGRGTSADGPKAVKHLIAAARHDHFGAQYWLGLLYRDGTLFKVATAEQDAPKAAALFERAADKGVALAQIDLALAYFNGEGVKQDRHEALKWRDRAAASDDAAALSEVAKSFEEGWFGPPDEAEAVKSYFKAAKAGDDYAAERLKELTG